NYLIPFNGERMGFEGGERFFLFHEDDVFFSGVVLSFKDQRRDCRARFQDGQFTIHTADILDDEKLIDFNFFVVKKSSLKGLYEYYHNSCSIHVLFALLRNKFNALKADKISNYIADNLALGREKAEAKGKKEYAGRLSTSILIDNRDIPTVLAEYAKVKKIEMLFDAQQFAVGHAVALQRSSREVKVSFNITDSEQSNIDRLTQGVVELAGNVGFKKGSVSTVDSDDIERTISILNCPKRLGECEFEDLAHRIDGLTVENFHENEILVELKREINEGEYRALFN
ncbi:hypothetical protein LWU99_004401, partial [Salmonella enterica]|nr:hypothetical protein [Salmonella enterica]EEC3700630.1 hypothetical protein [Salmonella enterica]EIR2871223.1 hypothetical protein [Salmonella enterica]EIV4424527.1 hypothetical protein [Salmonella enterica]EJH2817114.1 hypothetical protein [Salmonella enterica]